jgi:hypothetical protein
LVRRLFELDAAWALDQPPGSLDLKAMLRDTLAALEQLLPAPAGSGRILLRALIPALAQVEAAVRQGRLPTEAYSMIQAAIPKTVEHLPPA